MNNFKKYIYINECCHCNLRYLGIHDYYAKDAGYIIDNPFSKYCKLKTAENDIPEFL